MAVPRLRVWCHHDNGSVFELGEFENMRDALTAAQHHADRAAGGGNSKPLVWHSDIDTREITAELATSWYRIAFRRWIGYDAHTRHPLD